MSWHEWIRTVEVEPSVYAADFSHLGDQVDTLLRAGARVFHFDVGDGHFIEPVTIGPVVVQALAPIIHREGGAIDCHLMVDEPEHHFEALRRAGADSVTFHLEVCDDPPALAARAHEHALQAGLAVKPETSVDEAARAADGFELVLCMSVNPGYSGQQFMPEAIDRIRELRSLLPGDVHVQVDGGIANENIRSVYDAGANLIVCGAAIFGMEDLPRAYRRLVHELA